MTDIDLHTDIAELTLVVGPFESGDPISLRTFSERLHTDGLVHTIVPSRQVVRIPLSGVTFDRLRTAVVRCLEVQDALRDE